MRASLRCLAALLVALLAGCARDDLRLSDVEAAIYLTKPATVRVNAVTNAEFEYDSETIALLERAFREAGIEVSAARFGDGPLRVSTGTGGSGSGVIVRSDGLIVTSAHVIEPLLEPARIDQELRRNGAIAALRRHFDTKTLESLRQNDELDAVIDILARRGRVADRRSTRAIDFSDGSRSDYRVTRRTRPLESGGSDVALLEVDRTGLPAARIGDSSRVAIGSSVIAIGYPAAASSADDRLGGWISPESDLESTVHQGRITAFKRSSANETIFQTDVSLSAGSSGGPVVNERGEVIAIASAGLRDVERVRFVVPVAAASALLNAEGKKLDEPQTGFSRFWISAIGAARGGDWLLAREEARKARMLQPDAPDVARFLQESERRIPSMPFWRRHPIFALAGAISLILLMAALLIAVRAPKEELGEDSREVEFIVPTRTQENRSLIGKLTILNGARAGERLGLGGSGIRIGREASICEIVLENPKVSRIHAEVVEVEGKVLLIDRNSSNGTYVNDRRVDRHYLHDGDIIYFGGRNAVAVAFHS